MTNIDLTQYMSGSKILKFPHCDPVWQIFERIVFYKSSQHCFSLKYIVLKNDSYKYRLKWLCEPRISSMNKSPYLRFKVSNLISWRTEGMIRLLNEKFVVAYFRLGCNAEKIEICLDLSVLQRNGINKLEIKKNVLGGTISRNLPILKKYHEKIITLFSKKQRKSCTVRKFSTFSAIQILREINFRK